MTEGLDAYVEVVRFPVHWGEMDALGHVNHVRYIAWFETARMAMFARLGLTETGDTTMGPILANVSCDYRAPVTWPADVAVGARIGRIGRTSFVTEYGVFVDGETPTLVAQGQAVIVLFNYRDGVTVPVPDPLREAIAAL